MPPEPDNQGLNRAHHQLRASGVKDTESNPCRSGVHTRGYLPHLKREGAEYFVTFRLADSLPREVVMRLESEKAARLRQLAAKPSVPGNVMEHERIIIRDFHREIERALDRCLGNCALRDPRVADLVANAIRFFDTERYILREWVVMPNHVHVLFWPMPNHNVSEIVKSWKQYTSLRAKRKLNLPQGRFWQPEPYDHWVRDDKDRERIAGYIRRNPATAMLCKAPEEWQWSSAWRKNTAIS